MQNRRGEGGGLEVAVLHCYMLVMKYRTKNVEGAGGRD